MLLLLYRQPRHGDVASRRPCSLTLWTRTLAYRLSDCNSKVSDRSFNTCLPWRRRQDCISINTVNIYSLRNPIKRKTFFRDLNKSYDIACVRYENKELWEYECGGGLFCSSVSNHNMGQLILVRKNFPDEVKQALKTDWLLCIEVIINENTILIANTYSPNSHTEKKKKKKIIKVMNDNLNKFEREQNYLGWLIFIALWTMI